MEESINVSSYAEFQKHASGYVVPSKFLFDKESQVTNCLKRFNSSRTELNMKEEIFRVVDKSLLTAGQRASVMCGGGVDSTFLLIRAAELSLNYDAISAATGNNIRGLMLVDQICSKYGLKHYKFSPNVKNSKKFLNKFNAEYGRLPNDPVVPLVFEITEFAKSLNYEMCIDGQFADTIFFANPQNKLAAKTRLVPGLPFSPSGIDRSHKKHKLNQLSSFIRLDMPRRILFLSRIELEEAAIRFVADLLKYFHYQHVLQAIFWEVLINYRERDKYLLTDIPIRSPFDSEALFVASAVNDLGFGKRILRSYVEERFRDARTLLHSASFRSS